MGGKRNGEVCSSFFLGGGGEEGGRAEKHLRFA